MTRVEVLTTSPRGTEQLGERLGRLLKPGMLLALHGELGGGKTCLTRGLVTGAAPDSADLVASPTFAIMNEYPGNPPVYHFDFYRLGGVNDIAELGFEEYLNGSGICIVEWAERLGDLLPADHISITFGICGDTGRNIAFEARGDMSEAVLKQLENSEA